jgi:preprotein translocase subunit SecF
MIVVQNRNIFFAVTGTLALAAILSIVVFGLKLGTDFTGGTLVQVVYPDGRPAPQALSAALNEAGFEGYSLREAETDDYILRAANLTEEQRENLPTMFSLEGEHAVDIAQLTEVGPIIGKELRNKALIALALVLTAILFFIAFAFRKVSKPISSWVYGLIALVTLGFDVLIPVGFYAALGNFTGAAVDTLFVTAVLTVLGYSVHDTIVVFDRVRENLRINQERNRREDFAETAGRALNQTFVRSMTTSATTALALTALYVLGPASTTDFSLTLLVGVIVGTYSSIFLATPLLVVIEARYAKRK